MSRIGKMVIKLPGEVKVDFREGEIRVKGPGGELSCRLPEEVELVASEGKLELKRKSEDRVAKARHGLARALVMNMVVGVTKGFERRLEVNGIGYRAESDGVNLTLNVGYSKPVKFKAPSGVKIEVERNVLVVVKGADKHLVGETAAKIRKIRPPEPYKASGIKYVEEHIRRKTGKAVVSTTGTA